MNDFTATNGIAIRAKDGDLDFKRPGSYGWFGLYGGQVVDALREFFQAEADERLGRWRSTVDPAWTAVVDTGSSLVYFHHDDGLHEFNVYLSGSGINRWTQELQAVAREYFDAHPEPKPWHDAKPGEVWELTLEGEEPAAFYPSKSLDRRFTPVMPSTGTTAVPFDWPLITAGRRIWPEVAS